MTKTNQKDKCVSVGYKDHVTVFHTTVLKILPSQDNSYPKFIVTA